MEIQWLDGYVCKRWRGVRAGRYPGRPGCFRPGRDRARGGWGDGGDAAAPRRLCRAVGIRREGNINVALDAIGDVTARDRGAGPAVRAALDMALHDLIGKGRGVPVHALLGGARRTVFTLTESF